MAAGSVLPPDTLIPAGQFWAGNPIKYIRDVDDDEKANAKKVINCQELFSCYF